MKKNLLLLLAVIATTMTATAQSTAKAIEGTYTGDLYISLFEPIGDETEKDETPRSVNIVADGENTVTFSLYDFAFMGMPLGDIVLEKIPVSETPEKSVVFGDKEPVFLSFQPAGIEATAKINSGTSMVSGNNLSADIDVVWTNGGDAPIYVRFVGTRPSDPTGIGSIATTTDARTGIYTLSGIRVSAGSTKGLPKGIYVVNGKKTFVK